MGVVLMTRRRGGGGDGKKGGPLRVAFSGFYVLLKNVEPLLRFKQGVFGDLK